MEEILVWKAGSPHRRKFPWGQSRPDGDTQARSGEWEAGSSMEMGNPS